MKNLKCIIATIMVYGSLACTNQSLAVEQSECAGAAMLLRGGSLVEMTIGNETLLVKGTAVPISCWIQVEVIKGQNSGRKYWMNLMQVSKFADPRS